MLRLLRSGCVYVQDVWGWGVLTSGPADGAEVIFSAEEKMLLCKWLQIPAFDSNLYLQYPACELSDCEFFWRNSCKIVPWALEVREEWSCEGFSYVRVTETEVKKDHLYFEERANEGRKERKKAWMNPPWDHYALLCRSEKRKLQ